MRALLHIGTEKTGTTSIQAFLYHNRSVLAEHGYALLESAGVENNRWVPSYCMSEDRTDDFWTGLGTGTRADRQSRKEQFRDRFDTELRSLPPGTHTVVITSEHFQSRLVRQGEVDAVGDLLEPYFSEFRILCYLREQTDMCTSLYSTALKVGHSEAFDDFVGGCVPEDPYYDYASLLDRWARRFGSDALDVRLFGRSEFLGGDLLDDFAHALSPDLVGVLDKDIRVENESLTPTGQVIARAWNTAFKPAEDLFLRREGMRVISHRFAGRGAQATPEQRARIRKDFSVGNEAVRRAYFPERSSLFPEAGDGSAATDSAEDVVDGLVELLELVRIGLAGRLLPDRYADTLRDLANGAKADDREGAHRALLLAGAVRPTGVAIRRTLARWRREQR